MKSFVSDGENYFITTYVQFNDTEGDVRIHIAGLEMDLGRFYTSAQNAAFVTPHKTRGNANPTFKGGSI